ncbi:MAG: hypothetical protein P8L39_01620, partial [Halioglobus sp.]|nr:hypothetical protein [Halioglobus sp.]
MTQTSNHRFSAMRIPPAKSPTGKHTKKDNYASQESNSGAVTPAISQGEAAKRHASMADPTR